MGQSLGFGFRVFGQRRRVFKADMHAFYFSRKHRAGLVRLVTESDYEIKRDVYQFVDVF
jgi:hypothetical protein